MHKGRVHTPAVLEPYERPVAQVAIERGADAVISHHAHIARGIEFHGGRPIFHGLGNGCVVTRALSPAQDHPARAEWARKRRELFGFEPEEGYDLAPFHPEAKLAFLGRITLVAGRIAQGIDRPGIRRSAWPSGPRRGREGRRRCEDISSGSRPMAGLPPIVVAPDGAVREAA